MATDQLTLGIIAGNGVLPSLVARGAKASGYRVCCIGLRNQFDTSLPKECDEFSVVGVAKIGRWIRLLKKWNIHGFSNLHASVAAPS